MQFAVFSLLELREILMIVAWGEKTCIFILFVQVFILFVRLAGVAQLSDFIPIIGPL